MSNEKNSNLEDVSKGNDESVPGKEDSTSNKKTRFTKSKSISEVFKELEFDDGEPNSDLSDDLESAQLSDDFDSGEFSDDLEDGELDSGLSDDFDDDSADEIIPIHNEYKDLDESEALDEESVEGGIVINPDSDDLAKGNVKKSIDYIDSMEDTDSISGEADFVGSGESIDGVEDIDDEDFIAGKSSDDVLADEDMEERIGKSSAQGVLINDKDKTPVPDKSLDIFNSSTIISIVGFIVGLGILLIGITYYGSSSDRVVDNVLSGETAGLAILLVIIGLIIIGFSLLKFFSSSKSSLIIDTFNSIKSIDYDEVSEDVISREDFDAVFSIFKKNKDSNFSDNDKSVDSSKDLFEKDQEGELSDEDISSLYSESNLTSQKNQSSSKGRENANSTEISQDYDDGADEIIPIHSRLNEQSSEGSLEDKYSKYDFDDDSDEDFDLVEEVGDGSDEELVGDAYDDGSDEELTEDVYEDSFEENPTEDVYEGSLDEVPAENNYLNPDDEDLFEEDLSEQDLSEEDLVEDVYEGIVEGTVDIYQLEEDSNSDRETEKTDGLEDKYSKYDFDDDSEEDLVEDSIDSKPQFKKSVDFSKFEKEPLTEDELAERERKARELEEKKRRIIEGTNFDNSLRKH